MEDYSILMSVYNKENPHYLKTSIQSMMNQSRKTNDFVIVCDGPVTGDVNNVIESYEQRYPEIFQIVRLPENVGLGKALNTGLHYCKNNLVARMDSDDISYENRCAKELQIFATQNVAVVGATVREFEKTTEHVTSERILPEHQEDILEFSKKRNPFNHPSVMFRKDRVEEVGGYQQYPLFEDYDLWVRILQKGYAGYNIQQPLLYMRAGNGMYSRRGGMDYVKCILNFKGHLHKEGFTTTREYLVSTLPHIVVSLMPNKLRRYIYKKKLRK